MNATFTAEQRAKSREARKKAIAENHFKTDWIDARLWAFEASKRGLRLPMWHKAPTSRLLRKWHESLDAEPFEAVYGCSPSRLIALNPRTPLRAFVGWMLERAT